MNGRQAPCVSVVDPIGPAIERVKTVLFSPFDLVKWLTIGFGAWLAQLGEPQGGGGGGGSGGSGGGPHRGIDLGDIRYGIGQAAHYVFNNLDWIVPVGIAVISVLIGMWLFMLWLSSRGRFMFLYCVTQNKAEVTDTWHRFRRHANSLFKFRAVVGLITVAAAITPFVLGGIVASVSTAALGFNPLTIVGIVAAVTFFVAVLIVGAVIGKFTKDFVVPIMYLRATGAVPAWQTLLDLLSANKARFILYILVQMAMAMAIGMMIFMAVCCTCCLAACLFVLPYVGTVALLPVHVFGRSYSLYYLAQYGPDFNAFEPQPAEPAVTGS